MARFSWPYVSICKLDIACAGKASGAERPGAQNGPNQCDLKHYQIAVVLHEKSSSVVYSNGSMARHSC